MKLRYLIAVVCLAVFALAVAPWRAQPNEPVAPPKTAGLNAAEQAARRELSNRLARLPPALPHTQVGKYSAETIQSVETAFRGMIAVRGLIIQERERSTLAQQILVMPGGVDLVREVLLDPAFARSAFGEFQAEARFYAIAVLKEVARLGNIDLVTETAAGLTGQLAAAGGEPDHGRAEDLMSIVAIVGERVGSQGLVDARSPVLTQLGCTPTLTAEVRVLCLRGLFQGVWAADGIEEAQAMIERVRTL